MADRITERRRYEKTAAKFAKLAALDAVGATKEKRKMSDTWQKRGGDTTGDLHKPERKRKPRDAGVSAGVSVPKGTGQFKKG